MNLTINRVHTSEEGTFGVMRFQDYPPFAVCLENPWQNNHANVSCIPHGRYWCKLVDSPKFGITFEVVKVPSRSHILFHAGNTHADTLGCILVAESFTDIGEVAGVGSSRKGFTEFMSLAPETGFWLNIHWGCSYD